MRSAPESSRRRALIMVALPVTGAFPGTAFGLPLDDRRMLEAMAFELGMLEPGFQHLARRVRSNVDVTRLSGSLREATQGLRAVVGAAVHTAKSSVPSLIEDDFSFGRTAEVHGVAFSHTELALLLVLGDMSTAPAA